MLDFHHFFLYLQFFFYNISQEILINIGTYIHNNYAQKKRKLKSTINNLNL